MNIATNLRLPITGVTQTFAIMGIRGSGKTTAGLVLAEEMLKAGQPVVIYDPVGACFGLKTSADGKRPGFPVVIFGGEHADVPLEETAGETIARVIVEERLPAILDCSLMRKGARVRFMSDFCEALYHRNREPLHFMVDEAHTIAPQRPFPEIARLLGAMEDLVLQGRRRGIGCTIISQRPALVNKNVLTQCAALVAMRIIGPQDRKAIEDWIEAHGDKSQSTELLRSLPSLKVGEGWIWSPGWQGMLKRIHFRKRETFDSSATPEVGKRVVTPKVAAAIDLEALGEQIRATVEKAKADDPRELRRKIAALEKELTAARQMEPERERVEVPAVSDEVREQFHDAISAVCQAIEEFKSAAEPVAAALKSAAEPRRDLAGKRIQPARAQPLAPRTASLTRTADPSGAKLPGGERKILAALAQYTAGRTKVQIALLTGYAHGGGGFNNYLSSLRGKGFIDGRGETIQITDEGLGALGPFEPLPTGAELFRLWLGRVGKAEREVLQVLYDVFPGAIGKEEIAARTPSQYAPGGGGFNNAISRLRTLELIRGYGDMSASEEFFE